MTRGRKQHRQQWTREQLAALQWTAEQLRAAQWDERQVTAEQTRFAAQVREARRNFGEPDG